jgi:hypothetical protein
MWLYKRGLVDQNSDLIRVVVFNGSGFIRGGILHLIVENFNGNIRNLLFIIPAAIVNGRINVDNQRIIMFIYSNINHH